MFELEGYQDTGNNRREKAAAMLLIYQLKYPPSYTAER
jgi:hypothetical protein